MTFLYITLSKSFDTFYFHLLKSIGIKANQKFNCDSALLDMFVKDTQELSDLTQIDFTALGYPFK